MEFCQDINSRMRLSELEAKKKTLYVSRYLKNTEDVLAWAKEQGFTSTLDPDDLHVTICYSTALVAWQDTKQKSDDLVISGEDDDHREVEKFDGGATVLRFSSKDLSNRWQALQDIGASTSYPDYKAHVTITYNPGDLDIDDITPYRGDLVFGPEVFAELNTNWKADCEEVPLEESTSLDFAFRRRPPLLEMRTTLANGVRIFINPLQSELFALMDRFDVVRGLMWSGDVYVWDAQSAVHMAVMHGLGLPPEAYQNRFAVFWAGTDSLDWADEWSDTPRNAHFDLHGVVLACRSDRVAALRASKPFCRVVDGRGTSAAN